MVKKAKKGLKSLKKSSLSVVPVIRRPANLTEWYEYSWRKYADFSGRASRSEFWVFFLTTVLMIGLVAAMEILMGYYLLFTTIFSFITLLPIFAVWARRFNDLNKSKWLAFSPLIIFQGFLMLEFIRALLAVDGHELMPESWIFFIYMFLISAAFVMQAVCVAMLLMRGTMGPNRFGPMPRF